MKRRGHNSGFTLVEISVASSLMLIAVGLACTGFIYVLRGGAQSAVQDELDIDVQKAMERIKYDLRLSSLNKMLFYPAGTPPFAGISFPMARDDDGDGAVELNLEGRIIWDRTVIYHVWVGKPNQLRVTVFDPRDNSLTDLQRQQQLDYVAVHGEGKGTHNGAAATTKVVFENLFDWSIVPQSATLDGYGPSIERRVGWPLGSLALAGGTHDFRFKLVGKHPASSGYDLQIDSLVVSPSYGQREAEAQLPAKTSLGAVPVGEYMEGGSWDGNYQLRFSPSSPGHYFTLTMDNDRWEETNFSDRRVTHYRTATRFDKDLSPKNFVVTMEGHGLAWYANEQTGDETGRTGPADVVRGNAVRVLVRGEDMIAGNWIRHDGGNCLINFRAGDFPGDSSKRFTVQNAFIAQCADAANPSPDAVPGTQVKLRFWNGSTWSDGLEIANGGNAWASYPASTAVPISRNKSYLISYLVHSGTDKGNAYIWSERRDPSVPGSYLLTSTNVGPVETAMAVWSGRSDLLSRTNLYGVQFIQTSLPTNGVFTSGIYDTHLPAPEYTSFSWSADVPSGAKLSMQLRTGNQPDLSDTPGWSNAVPVSSPGAIMLAAKRYVQCRAGFTPNSTLWGTESPKLKDFTLKWNGQASVVDIGGTFTRGPRNGIYEITVDGQPLQTGIVIALEIFQDTRAWKASKRLISGLTAEVTPRNTGK